MRAHKSFEEIPSNSWENVLEVVEKDFDCKPMPELLSEFSKLLGNEKVEWGGVAAMKACVEEFFRWKKAEGSTAKVYTATEFFEKFLFSRNCYVHIQGPDHPSTTEAVNLGAVVPTDVPYANPEKLKALDPSTSKTVVDPPKNPKTSKEIEEEEEKGGTIDGCGEDEEKSSTVDGCVENEKKWYHRFWGPDLPSTSKAVTQGAAGETSVLLIVKVCYVTLNVKQLGPIFWLEICNVKVKIYMGSGWDIDFPKLHRRSPPDLFVNFKIHGIRSQETTVKIKTKTPCWGEEFVFRLSGPEDVQLIVKVYGYNKFAGMFCQSVSGLKPGILVIPLSYEWGEPCSLARLLVRFMFV